ncbi:hypothetical protein DL96DRAFT_1618994, partial [Flagelloscypha sp. PMI_526]
VNFLLTSLFVSFTQAATTTSFATVYLAPTPIPTLFALTIPPSCQKTLYSMAPFSSQYSVYLVNGDYNNVGGCSMPTTSRPPAATGKLSIQPSGGYVLSIPTARVAQYPALIQSCSKLPSGLMGCVETHFGTYTTVYSVPMPSGYTYTLAGVTFSQTYSMKTETSTVTGATTWTAALAAVATVSSTRYLSPTYSSTSSKSKGIDGNTATTVGIVCGVLFVCFVVGMSIYKTKRHSRKKMVRTPNSLPTPVTVNIHPRTTLASAPSTRHSRHPSQEVLLLQSRINELESQLNSQLPVYPGPPSNETSTVLQSRVNELESQLQPPAYEDRPPQR